MFCIINAQSKVVVNKQCVFRRQYDLLISEAHFSENATNLHAA